MQLGGDAAAVPPAGGLGGVRQEQIAGVALARPRGPRWSSAGALIELVEVDHVAGEGDDLRGLVAVGAAHDVAVLHAQELGAALLDDLRPLGQVRGHLLGIARVVQQQPEQVAVLAPGRGCGS